MSITLEITESRFAKELRSGFIFIIRNGERICCRGRIKPNGKTFFDDAGTFPTKSIARRMAGIAKTYGEDGEMPEDLTFAEDDAQAETEPAPAPTAAEVAVSVPEKPKRKARKTKS